MFRTVPLSIIRSFFTVHTAIVYVIPVCWQLASRIRTELQFCPEKTPHDEQRNCPKHAEFYSKNKFEKLVHLVGFIISIYHDARSPERQRPKYVYIDCLPQYKISCKRANASQCRLSIPTLNGFVLLKDTCMSTTQRDALLRFHGNNCYANAPQCYVIRKLPILLY